MKKTIVLLAAVSVTAFSACSNSGAKGIKTESDSLAYAIGVDLGTSLKSFDSTLNMDVLTEALKATMKGKSGMTQEESMAFVREYMMVRKPAKAKKESEEFISKIEKENKKAVKTESGLIYEVIEAGDANVKAGSDADTVVVNYTGTLPNGTKFDSSFDRNEPATFPLNGVIPAWTEGMKLVGKGGKIKLFVPSNLGYGENGTMGGPIGPNQALVFEVEIVDVKPAVAAPATK